MKRRIRTHLSNLASEVAAKTVLVLAERNRSFALSTQQQGELQDLLADLITRLAEAAMAEEPPRRIEDSAAFVNRFVELAGSLSIAIESVRVCRDLIIDQLSNDHTYIVQEPTDQSELLQFPIILYQLIDQLVADFVDVDEQMESKRLASCPSAVAQELMQIVMQSEDLGVLVIDHKLMITVANPALAKMFGVDHEQITGKHIDETFLPHDSERFIQWAVERRQAGQHVFEQGVNRFLISTSPLYNNGALWGAIAVLRSMNDSNHYEAELTKREALAAVGQLAAGMAHEIRNPLTSIKGFIQLLREQNQSSQSESYFSVILAEIERIDGLLNDVLVLARYRDDQMKPERFQLMEEIYGVLRLLEPEANRRGIRLEYECATASLYVHGHRARIKQAILNLVKNALEALLSSGTLIQVSVAASINQVVITVEDNGPGLSEESQMHLFVPFYTTKPEGTGLGLSTTQRIINDHGGEIYADNSPKLGGARFVIRLPLVLST